MASYKTNNRVKSSRFCGMKTKSSLITSEEAKLIIQQANDYLEELVNNKTFSGSVLLARNDQILLIKGYGYAEYLNHEKNTSQTIYRIGSITKTFTSIIILKLHEKQELNLKNKLSHYYPDYPNSNRITIKHLLSNTSGIEDYTETKLFEKKCHENLTMNELIDMFKDQPLKFRPGSKYSYSNSNYILLGLIIEKVTGKSYELNLREFILQPCSMNDTGYECDSNHVFNTKHQQRACGYVCNDDSNTFETCQLINMSTARSAGGIYSTVEDLYHMDRCLYGEQILRNRTKKLMFKTVKKSYALGWEIYRLKHRRIRQQHIGQIFGFMSCLARFPNNDACIIILSNLENTSIHDHIECLTNILFQENNN